MFNRRNLIKTTLLAPILGYFKPKSEDNIIMTGNPELYAEDIEKYGSLNKIPPLDGMIVHLSGVYPRHNS